MLRGVLPAPPGHGPRPCSAPPLLRPAPIRSPGSPAPLRSLPLRSRPFFARLRWPTLERGWSFRSWRVEGRRRTAGEARRRTSKAATPFPFRRLWAGLDIGLKMLRVHPMRNDPSKFAASSPEHKAAWTCSLTPHCMGRVLSQARGQGCIRRQGASQAAPEAVRRAVGGGPQSGWGRLLSVTNATGAGTWCQGDSGWA